MKRKLRLGLLGTGVAARTLYLPAFARLTDRVEVVACASRHRENAASYARLADIPLVAGGARELLSLPHLDAVFISLPIHLQPRVVLTALAVRRLFGMPVELERLTASFAEDLPPIDTAVAVLRFAGGAVGTWTSCFSARDQGPLLRVLGSQANAELHRDRVVRRTAGGRETVVRSAVDTYEAQLRHFAAVVLDGAPAAVTPADGLADLALIAAICGGGALPRSGPSRGRRRMR